MFDFLLEKYFVCFFFFKQKTAYEIGTGDWSSDVCSSDLACKIEPGSHYVAARINARRACQKAMIADVVDALEAPDVIRLARASGIRIKS